MKWKKCPDSFYNEYELLDKYDHPLVIIGWYSESEKKVYKVYSHSLLAMLFEVHRGFTDIRDIKKYVENKVKNWMNANLSEMNV